MEMREMLRIQDVSEQSATEGMQGNLLIIDDETSITTLLERQFRNDYTVRTAASGEDALDIINSGFIPHVILSDQRMPGMSGVEFLAASQQLVPDAVRVILTGYSDIQDIIASINEGHVYKFITKPWEQEILAQAIHHCFQHYRLATENKRLLAEVQEQNEQISAQNRKLTVQNEELSRLNSQIQRHMVEAVKLLSGLMPGNTHIYYTNHAQTVAMIARAIAEELCYSEESINSIVIASILHDVGKVGLPERCITPAPDVLPKKDIACYQTHAERGYNLINTISGLETVADIVYQHHEHYDGSGFPQRLEGKQISPAAMIVGLADLYHNRVYRIPTSVLAGNSFVQQNYTQSQVETAYRQTQAMSYIFRVSAWFDPDVLQAFYRVAQKGSCAPLQLGAIDESKDAKLVEMLRRKYSGTSQSA